MVHTPLPESIAWQRVGRCFLRSLRMLIKGEVHFPQEHVGRRLHFADGTTGQVYRETVTARDAAEPCFLAVSFRLRLVRGPGHALFRAESLLNTPLFVGFPGFVSKLWLADDGAGRYRGLYEWDGAEQAEAYARALWRVLELVSVPGSIDYEVVPGLRRDDVLANPALLAREEPTRGRPPWWRVVA